MFVIFEKSYNNISFDIFGKVPSPYLSVYLIPKNALMPWFGAKT